MLGRDLWARLPQFLPEHNVDQGIALQQRSHQRVNIFGNLKSRLVAFEQKPEIAYAHWFHYLTALTVVLIGRRIMLRPAAE